MFENNKVSNQYGEVAISRYIASWLNVTGQTAIQAKYDRNFARFLREECNFSYEDCSKAADLLTGKMEIEHDLKAWLARQPLSDKELEELLL